MRILMPWAGFRAKSRTTRKLSAQSRYEEFQELFCIHSKTYFYLWTSLYLGYPAIALSFMSLNTKGQSLLSSQLSADRYSNGEGIMKIIDFRFRSEPPIAGMIPCGFHYECRKRGWASENSPAMGGIPGEVPDDA